MINRHCKSLAGLSFTNRTRRLLIAVLSSCIAIQCTQSSNLKDEEFQDGNLYSSLTDTRSKTIIVSDVDDTVKISYSLSDLGDPNGKEAYRPKTNCYFRGMNDLYNSLYNAILEKEPSADLFYLTNAPKSRMKEYHRSLLKSGGFPNPKEIIFRRDEDRKTFKTKVLRKLIRKKSPKRVILIGDNGQEDTEHYATVADEFPEIKFFTFIRAAYPFDTSYSPHGAPLRKNQMAFVTPIEIALTLQDAGVLSSETVAPLVEDIAEQLLEEVDARKNDSIDKFDPQFFPDWQGCQGIDEPTFTSPISSLVEQALEYIYSDRCAQ